MVWMDVHPIIEYGSTLQGVVNHVEKNGFLILVYQYGMGGIIEILIERRNKDIRLGIERI